MQAVKANLLIVIANTFRSKDKLIIAKQDNAKFLISMRIAAKWASRQASRIDAFRFIHRNGG